MALCLINLINEIMDFLWSTRKLIEILQMVEVILLPPKGKEVELWVALPANHGLILFSCALTIFTFLQASWSLVLGECLEVDVVGQANGAYQLVSFNTLFFRTRRVSVL